MSDIQTALITPHQFTTHYKELRVVEVSEGQRIKIICHCPTKRKMLLVEKELEEGADVNDMIKAARTNRGRKSRGVNHLVGCVLLRRSGKAIRDETSTLGIMFEFAQSTLEDTWVKSKKMASQKRLAILAEFHHRLTALVSHLQQQGYDLTKITFDPRLIVFCDPFDMQSELKLTLLPSFVDLVSTPSFTHHIYSPTLLRAISLSQSQHPLDRIKQQHCLSWDSSETLVQMGLLCLRTAWQLCDQVTEPVEKLLLYDMNQKFEIDYNWSFIEAQLKRMETVKEYVRIGRMVRKMLEADKNKMTLGQYNAKVHGSSQKDSTPRSHQNSYHVTKIPSAVDFSKNKESNSRKTTKEAPQQTIVQRKLKQIRKALEQTKQKSLSYRQVAYQDESAYQGQFRGSQRHGYGVYTFKEGQIYGGEWTDDEMTGRGLYIFVQEGAVYEGEVQCGVKEGKGSYHYRNGNEYVGEWANDLKHGFGTFTDRGKREIYEGYFGENYKSGRGTITEVGGRQFKGSFARGKKEGQGEVLSAQGRLEFRGRWHLDELQETHGQIFFQCGDHYQGELRGGRMEGQGKYRYASGVQIEGLFEGDSVEGVVTWGGSSEFEGVVNLRQDAMKGQFAWLGGQMGATGESRNGKMHGRCTFDYKGQVGLVAEMFQGILDRHEFESKASEN